MSRHQEPFAGDEATATDYVDWCGEVLSVAVRLTDSHPKIGMSGVTYADIVRELRAECAESSDMGRRLEVATRFAGADLAAVGLLNELIGKNSGRPNGVYRLLQAGREADADPTRVWESICQRTVEQEHATVLSAINRVSTKSICGWSISDRVFTPVVLEELDSIDSEDAMRVVNIARELSTQGLVWFDGGGKSMVVRATYAGCVWETRREYTIEAREIETLIGHGETTSVEFKRLVNTKTKDEKAELVKDILGLANTQASPPHVLIIGFDDKTLEYVERPDSGFTQDDLERILSAYASPVPQVRYREIACPRGKVGRIDVLRNPTQLPYRVKASVGDKKRIEEGVVFVRHGSQTVHASEEEVQALIEEAEWARVKTSNLGQRD